MPNGRIPRRLLGWVPPHGSRPVGRLRLQRMLLDDLSLLLGEVCSLADGVRVANNRDSWRLLLKSLALSKENIN